MFLLACLIKKWTNVSSLLFFLICKWFHNQINNYGANQSLLLRLAQKKTMTETQCDDDTTRSWTFPESAWWWCGNGKESPQSFIIRCHWLIGHGWCNLLGKRIPNSFQPSRIYLVFGPRERRSPPNRDFTRSDMEQSELKYVALCWRACGWAKDGRWTTFMEEKRRRRQRFCLETGWYKAGQGGREGKWGEMRTEIVSLRFGCLIESVRIRVGL